MDKAHQKGVIPNRFTYRVMIRMYCAQGEMNKAKDFIDSMAIQGFAPDLLAYTMLINGHVKSKRNEKTLRLAEEMLQKRLTLGFFSFNSELLGFVCMWNFLQN